MKKKILLASIALSFVFTTAQVNQDQIYDLAIRNIQGISNVKKVNLKNQISSLNSLAKSKQLQIVLPTKKSNERFVLVERELLSPKLKEKYPNIKSYYGYSLDNPNVRITASFSPSKGFSALMYGGEEKQMINKIDGDAYTYGIYGENELSGLSAFNCGTVVESAFNDGTNTLTKRDNPKQYRKYKLAVVTDYDYNLYHAKGGDVTIEKSLAAVVESLSIIFPIYENDLSILFELVDDMDKITFLTKESDPYTSENLNAKTQSELNSKIGAANYDLGILFTNKLGGGNAGAIGSVCRNTTKGSAYMGYVEANKPEGFSFSVAAGHEMGHQFGGNHTHARNEGYQANREIGSGVTVMGYPGVTSTHDVQGTFIPQFHNNTMVQINNYLSRQTCGTKIDNNNNVPIVNAGQDYSIPQGTAFRLTGSATDDDSADVLTYSWEQNDPLTDFTGNNFKNPSSENRNGANYRVFAAHNSPVQYFPPIGDVLNGSLTTNWNQPPTVSKTMNFVLSVRDNKIGGGQTGGAGMKVNVTDNAPFRISNINLNQTIRSGQSFELKWDVSGTDTGVINAKNVKISLTTDDGKTFTTLVESTPNDGSEIITIPSSLKSKKANIIVEAIDNIFYAASPSIAVDYEVSLVCNEYYTSSIDIPDGNFINQNVKVSDAASGLVEDISIITDITHPRSSDLQILLARVGVDNYYRTLINSGCGGNPYPNYTFNINGSSVFNSNCTQGAVIQPPTPEYLSNYIGKPTEATYYFRVVDKVSGAVGKINKLGVKICKKEYKDIQLAVKDVAVNTAKVFPNPSNGNFNVRYNASSKSYKLEVYNISGQLVDSKIVDSAQKEDKSFNFSHLTKGVYVLRIIDGENILNQKLIIK